MSSNSALITSCAGGPMPASDFDPHAKEAQLRAESSSWDTSSPIDADDGDIPIIDLAAAVEHRNAVAAQLDDACEHVGFFQLINHGVERDLIDATFDMAHRFHALPLADKQAIAMDQPDWPVGGVGYLPMRNRKLPTRDRGNLNEAFIAKAQVGVELDDNRWPADAVLPGFRETIERYAAAVNHLALRLVSLYEAALGLEPGHFDTAFTDPTWRLRLTHYPPDESLGASAGDFGIAPHVDTTFFTLLLQDAPGLSIFSHRRRRWLRVPVVDGAYVVNSGELLKHWTNDRYMSVRHFASNGADAARYSIPFFYNANADHRMEPLATCVDDDHPARYPVISYRESQATAQGE